jgi:FAD/FMN-containing dehydrogenase
VAVLRARTNSGQYTTLEDRAVDDLSSKLRGRLIREGEEGYEEARTVWNGMIDRRPALIARCAEAADVIEAVNFARDNALLVSVRGGGHGVAGLATCDGGVVIDLSPMKVVQVDVQAGTARAEGGATWADVDLATQRHGLATPGGVVSETGIAGLTLGGGLGWLRNKYGLSCDNLLSVEIVTADGRLLKASETENPDLFWGIRGGGGNFGVVTSFEYRLHTVGPEVMFGLVLYRGERIREVLRFFRAYTATAPDEVALLAFAGVVPATKSYPHEIHGSRFIALAGVYAGPVEDGARALQPVRNLPDPLLDLSGRMPYLQVQQILDEDYPAHQLRYYWKSLNLLELSDDAIEQIAVRAERQPSPLSTVEVWHLGGAIRRVPEDAMAFSGRQVPYLLNAEANWADPREDEANIQWVRWVVEGMARFSDGGRYLNFPGFFEEGEAGIRATFGAKHERLVELKNRYDPTNLFQLNQNIRPRRRKVA